MSTIKDGAHYTGKVVVPEEAVPVLLAAINEYYRLRKAGRK